MLSTYNVAVFLRLFFLKEKLSALAFHSHDRKLKSATVRCDTTHALQMNQCTFTGNPDYCQKEREVMGSAMVISAAVCDLCCNYIMFVTCKPQQPTWTLLTSEPVLCPHFQKREIRCITLSL